MNANKDGMTNWQAPSSFAPKIAVPNRSRLSKPKGNALSLVTLLAGIVYLMMSLPKEMQSPIPAAMVFGLLTAWSGYLAWGKQKKSQ